MKIIEAHLLDDNGIQGQISINPSLVRSWTDVTLGSVQGTAVAFNNGHVITTNVTFGALNEHMNGFLSA